MSIVHGHRCDTCNAFDPTGPDDGTPTGWYLVARMTSPGCWDDDTEWHFDSTACLNEFTWGDE